MIFNLKTNKFTTFKRNNIHYLNADTTMFGSPLRLGDFSMYSCLLLCLKSQLIKMYPNRFNNKNLFFRLNRLGGLKVENIDQMLKLFPNIWKGYLVDLTDKNNIRQLISGGNIWTFKCYLEKNNIKIGDTHLNGMDVVNPSHLNISNNKRDTIYIMPVDGKKYNIERNFNFNDLISIINNIDSDQKIKIILKDVNNFNINSIKNNINSNINIHPIINDNWIDILSLIMKECKLFISGDCGLSHFVSMISPKYKPMMRIFYKTSPFIMDKDINHFDNSLRVINFKPYSLYKKDSIEISKF